MDRMEIDRAVHTLRREGFRITDISILFPDGVDSSERQAPRTTGSGALAMLAGVGALAVPGFGSFIAAGPIIGALASAAAVGTVGGVAGGLIGLGMTETDARRYEARIW